MEQNVSIYFCRLDYWLISDNLHDLVSKVDILASIKTDHSSIVLELEDIQEGYRGPGFWKLNTSLLTRPDYVDMINNELPIWLEEANNLSSTGSKWDWIKFKIKTSSIAYSKKVSKDRKQQEEELNFKYQSALKRLQENPNDETRLEAENLKNELEALYDKKVEGIIIRSRVRYFLNLENEITLRSILENCMSVVRFQRILLR